MYNIYNPYLYYAFILFMLLIYIITIYIVYLKLIVNSYLSGLLSNELHHLDDKYI